MESLLSLSRLVERGNLVLQIEEHRD